MRCSAILSAAVAFALAGGAGSAIASRRASHHEARRLAAAEKVLQETDGVLSVRLALVSTVSPRWARIVDGSGADTLLYFAGDRWRVKDTRERAQPREANCLVAPGRVMRDLYDIRCPARTRLRTRSTTLREQRQLEDAYRDAPLTAGWGYVVAFDRGCVSLYDTRWAVLVVAYADTAISWYFQLVRGGWRVPAHGNMPAPPPRWPAISLENSCAP